MRGGRMFNHPLCPRTGRHPIMMITKRSLLHNKRPIDLQGIIGQSKCVVFGTPRQFLLLLWVIAASHIGSAQVQSIQHYPQSNDSANVRLPIWKHLYHNHWAEGKWEGLRLHLNPWFHFNVSGQSSGTFIRNGRGVTLSGHWQKLHFFAGLQENQTGLFDFEERYAQNAGSIPREGRFKTRGENTYDYANAFGYIDMLWTRGWRSRLGHYNHRIGVGDRSMILSDLAYVYPQFENNIRLSKHFYYRFSMALLSDTERESNDAASADPYRVKPFNWYALTYQREKGAVTLLRLALWNRYSGIGFRREPQWETFSPVPIAGISDRERAAGWTAVTSHLLVQGFTVYQQFIWNEQNGRTGYQFGVKRQWVTRKLTALTGIEMNRSGQMLYHENRSLFAYTHAGQPLGHFMGSGGSEILFYTRFKRGRAIAEAEFSAGERRPYLPGTLPDATSCIAEDCRQLLPFTSTTLSAGWIINPKNNLRIQVTGILRDFDKNGQYWQVGLINPLFNQQRAL